MKQLSLSNNVSTKSSVNMKHNFDKDYRASLENVDANFSANNIVLENNYDLSKTFAQNVKKILQDHKKFDDVELALTHYNANKKDYRKITYNDLFKQSQKQHFTHKEIILEFGNMQSFPDAEHLELMYQKALDDWKAQHPNCYITGAVVHCDEPTAGPHMHLTFFTMEPRKEVKRGLELNFSYDNSIGRGRDAFTKDQNIFYEKMGKICREFGYEPKPIEHDAKRQLLQQVPPRYRGLVNKVVNTATREITNKCNNEIKEAQALKKEMHEKEKKLNAIPLYQKVYDKLWELNRAFGFDSAHDNTFSKLFTWLTKHSKDLGPFCQKEMQEPSHDVDLNRGKM